MLSKIRLFALGQLRHDFHKNLGIGFDGRCTRYLRIEYPKLVDRVLEGGTDKEVLEWCYENGRRLSDEDVLIWNQFATKRGWNDDSSDELEAYKRENGLAHRDDITTFFAFYVADEGGEKKPNKAVQPTTTCVMPRANESRME